MFLYNSEQRPSSLYIHWPFCPYKCNFCNFVALASHDQYMQRYHDALVHEIDQFCRRYSNPLHLETIYLGGGTPSTYPNNLLLDTFGRLRDTVIFNKTIEITIEVNPGTVSHEQLKVWKECGINRISIGVQSLNDSVLKKLNRHQKAHDVFNALSMIHEYMEAISVDLILGLPGISVQEWKEMLAMVVEWPIKHISIYFLMVHEDTPLYFGVKAKKITLPCDDEVVDLYHWSVDYLAEHGFKHYEISNFARLGFESRHNKTYWERKPFKGFGIGAYSFDGESRFQNNKNLMAYLEGVENNGDITSYAEKLTQEQIWLEKIMLGLRQDQGVILDELMGGLTETQKTKFCENIAWMESNNFVRKIGTKLKLTPKALPLENEIVLRLSL